MNLKVRIKNPVFWAQIVLTVIVTILGYFGLTGADITSWPILGQTLLAAISNPYVVFMVAVAVWNALNDPTTSGLADSVQARGYQVPRKS